MCCQDSLRCTSPAGISSSQDIDLKSERKFARHEEAQVILLFSKGERRNKLPTDVVVVGSVEVEVEVVSVEVVAEGDMHET